MFNQTAHLQSNLLAQAFFSNTLTPINYDNNTQGIMIYYYFVL